MAEKKPVPIPRAKPAEPKGITTLDNQAADHARRMGLLELRADYDDLLQTDPLARLGFDIIERGFYPNKETSDYGGKIVTMLTSPEGKAYALAGQMVPSEEAIIAVGEDPKTHADEISSLGVQRMLREQGVSQPSLPPSEGATVFYTQSTAEGPEYILNTENTRQILLHELSHLGAMALRADPSLADTMTVKKFNDPYIGSSYEESLLDARDYLARKDYYDENEEKDYFGKIEAYDLLRSAPSTIEMMEETNALAEQALANRGVPPQVTYKAKGGVAATKMKQGIGNLWGLFN